MVEKRFSNEYDCHVYKNYNSQDENSAFDTPSLSFISAIEAQGYYWDENPIKIDKYPKYGYAMDMSNLINTWQKAESKTFKLEHVFIYKIF